MVIVMSLEKARKIERLIRALDGYRIGRYTSIEKVERWVEELGIKLPYPWEELRKDVLAILNLPAVTEEYGKIKKMERLASKLGIANIPLTVSSIGVYIAGMSSGNATMVMVSLILLAVSVVIAYAVYFSKAYVNVKVAELYSRNADKLEKMGYRIKVTIEYLIRRLRRELRVAGYKLSEYRLKLWLPDYSGIRVVRKPSWLSAKYEVALS